jgi:hypothetical protein
MDLGCRQAELARAIRKRRRAERCRDLLDRYCIIFLISMTGVSPRRSR